MEVAEFLTKTKPKLIQAAMTTVDERPKKG